MVKKGDILRPGTGGGVPRGGSSGPSGPTPIPTGSLSEALGGGPKPGDVLTPRRSGGGGGPSTPSAPSGPTAASRACAPSQAQMQSRRLALARAVPVITAASGRRRGRRPAPRWS